MKIKKIIVVILMVCMSIDVCACSNQKGTYNEYQESEAHSETQPPKYDTAYPDDVLDFGANVITVEQALKDLLEHKYHECLQIGKITFDNLTTSYSGSSIYSTEATYWFDISIQYEYGKENYRAKVVYLGTNTSSFGVTKFAFSKADILQVDSTLTALGKWTYDDEDTHILVNFIRTDDSGYVVEYEIKYYASYWVGGQWIDTCSDGEMTVYGDNEYDGNNHYLYIDLRDFQDENGQTLDRGYIEVYPWSGVYWNALHSYGGPYKLSN